LDGTEIISKYRKVVVKYVPMLRRSAITLIRSRFYSSLKENFEIVESLVELDSTRLAYPKYDDSTGIKLDLTVNPASYGGHVVLGPNGSGKTLLSFGITDDSCESNVFVRGGSIRYGCNMNMNWNPKFHLSKVSFRSHSELLEKDETVYQALTPFGGKLSKASKYLVVRFGLFPLLHSDLKSISTGEIRKVLLVRALSTRPKLLVLDNAFDGLDVSSREKLKEILSKMLRGFRSDLLVQEVSAKDAARTQILLLTHRAEEIMDEISTVSFIRDGGGVTQSRSKRTGVQLLNSALIGDDFENSSNCPSVTNALKWYSMDHVWYDKNFPSNNDIANWWNNKCTSQNNVLLNISSLKVQRGDYIPLCDLNLTLRRGERWLVAGNNGAGKSTLSRMFTHFDTSTPNELGIVEGSLDMSISSDKIGWVSTELHMKMTHSDLTTNDVLLRQGLVQSHVGYQIAQWIIEDFRSILSRPFNTLSQGQQKLILIAAGIALRPSLLILDEPCQGLDHLNRCRVLGLLQRLCETNSSMGLIYITHHLEEVMPCITHVLHLEKGNTVFQGTYHQYKQTETLSHAVN